jgi:hypothetical protein
VSRDFQPSGFFVKTSVLGPWLRGWSLLEYKFKFTKIYKFFLNACCVIDTACTKNFLSNFKKWNSYTTQQWHAKKFKMHAVSMTPHAWCMSCHWYHMQNACGVVDTACTCACGVIDTACTLHAVSMIPQARCIRCHWHRMQNMTPHARSTNDSNGPGSL